MTTTRPKHTYVPAPPEVVAAYKADILANPAALRMVASNMYNRSLAPGALEAGAPFLRDLPEVEQAAWLDRAAASLS